MSVLARLRGPIEEKTAESVIVFVGGLGFELQVPLSTLSALPETGEETTLRTYLYVREGALALYGFLTEAEQRTFELLLTVSGVGPKAALNCLSLLRPEDIAGAIAGNDVSALRRVPGIGSKTAERIVLELKGKVKDLPQHVALASGASSIVMEALMFYGHSPAEAAAAIASVPNDTNLSDQEQILLALRYFAPRSETRG